VKTVHLLRLIVYILIGAALLIAAVPLLVLLSLVQGGSGFGLCPEGITSCRNPYTAAPELTMFLTVALLVIVAAIRIITRYARKLQSEEYKVSSPPSAAAEAQSNDRTTR
jgi:preprotein translocase subunit SecG